MKFKNRHLLFIISVGLVLVIFSIAILVRMNHSKIENQIIRAIDLQCVEEGECYIVLSEITEFEWDTVSVFMSGGDWVEINDALGLSASDTELQNGIVFSLKNEIVEKHISSYNYNDGTHPQLACWVERDIDAPYYKSYTFDHAILLAEKIKLEDGRFRYILYA